MTTATATRSRSITTNRTFAVSKRQGRKTVYLQIRLSEAEARGFARGYNRFAEPGEALAKVVRCLK